MTAQTPEDDPVQDTTRLATQPLASDSTALSDALLAPSDTLSQNDDSGSSITTTVNYHARDSMYFDLTSQQLSMFGDTHIDYGVIQLEAEVTKVDWVKQTIKSDFVVDSAGAKTGKPLFKDGDKVYVTDEILYDFKSRKAVISGVVTEQDGGFMHGARVKKNEINEMFVADALYTTCNLANPHFFISSKRLKVIPGNKVVSGPAHLKFREVPTPLWVPFAMFPQPRKKASGIVMPTYGEEQRRGFFLRDGGYYFAISDYTDLRVTGEIYSKGGYALNFNQNYFRRYKHRGTFNFAYTNSKIEPGSVLNDVVQNSYLVRWTHTPESRGNSRFSASVNIRSSSYNQNNNLVITNYKESVSSDFSSNISYSTKFRGTPYSMTANLRHSQNVQTKIMNLRLPELTLNMTRIYPFKNATKSSSSPLAKLSFSHTFSAKNELTNSPRSSFGFDVANENSDATDTLIFNAANLDKIYDRSKLGARHSVPISTSFNVLKYFTISPTLSYEELWYTRELKFTDYDDAAGGVRVDTVQGFSRAGSWRSSASLNSRLYGLYPVGWKNIQAIRHVITPSVSFSYNPDFGDPKYGVFSDVVVNANGDTQRLSKYQGFAYGSPPGGESRTVGFSVTNNLEMKVLDKKDTTGQSFRKVKLFDNLSASSGYNFAADSFKLSDITLSVRTSFFKNKLSLSTNATLDPYIYKLLSITETATGKQITQRKLDRFAWNNGQGLGQLKSLRTSLNLRLQGKSKATGAQEEGNKRAIGKDRSDPFNEQYDNLEVNDDELDQVIEHIQNNPDLYVDFNVPWSLNAAYTVSRSKAGFNEPTIRKSSTFGGSLGLTDKTQITFNSGYDFENKEFTTTRLSVHRDLHCWTLDFNWVPFGTYQSYMLSLRVKSPILQDLKVEKRRSFQDFFGN
ncbi:MAG: LPS-assembly protein LptD [Cytophagales bacterium]|nr:LPS-assembly protein LptD [Cytophagales bacterium]